MLRFEVLERSAEKCTDSLGPPVFGVEDDWQRVCKVIRHAYLPSSPSLVPGVRVLRFSTVFRAWSPSQRQDSRSRESQQSHRGYRQPYPQSSHSPRAQPYATPQQPQQVLYYPVASVPAPVTPVAQQQLAPATVMAAPAAFAPQATLMQGNFYQQAPVVQAPTPAPAPAPVALYAVAPSQQAPPPPPQVSLSLRCIF